MWGSFSFAKEIVEQDSEFIMKSLDVDSLLNSTALEETTDTCSNNFFENTERVEGLSKIEFKKLLILTIIDLLKSYLFYNEAFPERFILSG